MTLSSPRLRLRRLKRLKLIKGVVPIKAIRDVQMSYDLRDLCTRKPHSTDNLTIHVMIEFQQVCGIMATADGLITQVNPKRY